MSASPGSIRAGYAVSDQMPVGGNGIPTFSLIELLSRKSPCTDPSPVSTRAPVSE